MITLLTLLIAHDWSSNSFSEKNVNFEICGKKSDSFGRLLILKIKIDENVYVLCNVYAPTQDHKRDQINFLIDVKFFIHISKRKYTLRRRF